MGRIPTYALYGEAGTHQDPDFLHCETIASRSRLHDFRIRPHRHEHLFQMLFLSGGAGEVVFDGLHALLSPPCLVMVPAFVVHGYAFSNPVEGLVLTLYQRQAELILRAGRDQPQSLAGPLVVQLAEQPEAARTIAASLDAVASEFAGSAAGRVAMMEAQLTVAWLAACRAQHAPAALPGHAQPRGIGHLLRFREMIDRDFRDRVPIEDYASRLGVTPVHLRRLCREHLGTTPLAALNARVVLEAKRLLVFSTLEVKEIAGAVGVADDAYFSRFFRRETGLSPTAFRARQQTMGSSPPVARPPHSADTPPATGRSVA